jgi:hypothetical protein
MWALARLRLLPAASAACSSAGARAISASAAPRDLREFLDQASADSATYGAPRRGGDLGLAPSTPAAR